MVEQWVHDVRQWATDDCVGTRCDDQHNLQQSIEHMFLGVHQKKASLYTQTDSNKIHHLRRRKLGEEKKKLFETIKLYNEQVPDEEQIDEAKVESRLSVVGDDSGADLIWPWEVHSSDSSNILTKKIFDAYISKVQLQEEKVIVMREMRQHCTYPRNLAASIRTKISQMSSVRNSESLSEEGHRGLCCLLQKRLADVEEKFQVVCSTYSQALGPNAASLLEDWPEEIPEDHKEADCESSDDSDFEAM
ncbi:uncharacterized protein LOC130114380 [Lampris incognitus]|uniref:uncharacterized protein LOC130114380 n=1 Tax=Lampris incognitus TaxID=2546036 RepID=UPI0024B5FBC7|nr:uncharacterized protein LOC130114380 [Lampris incognitus]